MTPIWIVHKRIITWNLFWREMNIIESWFQVVFSWITCCQKLWFILFPFDQHHHHIQSKHIFILFQIKTTVSISKLEMRIKNKKKKQIENNNEKLKKVNFELNYLNITNWRKKRKLDWRMQTTIIQKQKLKNAKQRTLIMNKKWKEANFSIKKSNNNTNYKSNCVVLIVVYLK